VTITFYTYECVEEERIREKDRHTECMFAMKILVNSELYEVYAA
jgi:hypothetical protein